MQSLIVMALIQLASVSPAQAGDPTPTVRTPVERERGPESSADPVLRWNEIALDLIRKERTPPPVAARNLAIVHASIYDAVNAISGRHTHYLVKIEALPGASLEAAVAAAAYRSLIDLYPRQRDTLDTALKDSLAQLPEGDGKIYGTDLGRFVAEQVLAWRGEDGLDRKVRYAPPAVPGLWQRTPPDFAEPALPHWPSLTPFAMDKAHRLHPRDLPRLTDPAYTAAFQEVKEIGAVDSKTRTPEQTEIARFWADGAGTCTPPGHWNLIAQSVARQRGTSPVENARLFALLNIALADAGILCWECKYKLGFWRPVTAIRNADQDGNPDTAPDPSWTPLLATPPFPSYTSGHSTFSGAAAAVLADVFGDNVRFQTTSDELAGVTRSYTSFSAAAAEAGQSRVYGGIHWQFDNTEGLAMGHALGRFVCGSYLLTRNAESRTSAKENE